MAKTIFAVLGVSDPVAMKSMITTTFPADYFEIATGQWLVADHGTAQTVGEKLGVLDPGTNVALIVSLAGYTGRKSPTLWEWIRAKWGSE